MGMIEAADVLMLFADSALPQTGRAIPLLAAGVAIGVALLLRVGGSRLGGGRDDPSEPEHPSEPDAGGPSEG